MAHILSPAAMREIEAALFAPGGGGDAATAMEEAGRRIADLIRDAAPQPGTLLLVLSHGHNAGDALVAARHLADTGWSIRHFFCASERDLAPLTRQHLDTLGEDSRPFSPDTPLDLPPGPRVVLDGMVGLNARLPLSPALAEGVDLVNFLRATLGALVVTVDVPSGLDGDTGQPGTPCVRADITATVAAAKTGLLADAATDVVGRLAVLPLASLPVPAGADDAPFVATSELLAPLLPDRPATLHKGSAGRVAILAGSPGMTGAAALTALGALRAGAGLVTIYTLGEVVGEIAARCPAEAMVRPLPEHLSPEDLAALADAVVVGPGCGRHWDHRLPALLRHAPVPMLVDADALTALAIAGRPTPLQAPAPRLLTPHPGEFARLAPDLAPPAHPDRARAARAFADRWASCTLLLKGPRTIIAQQGRPLAYNVTGHHGLATGGSGDLLAGIAGALLARTQKARPAAMLAAWLHGRAAELTYSHGHPTESPESLTPTTTAKHLGLAFTSLRRHAP